MDAHQILMIDTAGMDAGTVLSSLVKAFGQKQGAAMFKQYAQKESECGPHA